MDVLDICKVFGELVVGLIRDIVYLAVRRFCQMFGWPVIRIGGEPQSSSRLGLVSSFHCTVNVGNVCSCSANEERDTHMYFSGQCNLGMDGLCGRKVTSGGTSGWVTNRRRAK